MGLVPRPRASASLADAWFVWRPLCEQLRKQSAQNMHVRKKDLATLRDAANRWTDNAFMIRKHFIEKCGMDAAGADHMLGTNQMDYVE